MLDDEFLHLIEAPRSLVEMKTQWRLLSEKLPASHSAAEARLSGTG
jgi:hypothetical protein